MWHGLEETELVLADTTGRDPHVFYVVALCMALEIPLVILSQASEDVPFDARRHPTLIYQDSPEGRKELSQKLKNLLVELQIGQEPEDEEADGEV